MKEATGEVSMTVITLVAIAVIGAILAALWPNIKERINGIWDPAEDCPAGQYWDSSANGGKGACQ